jgi:hypothetical protein
MGSNRAVQRRGACGASAATDGWAFAHTISTEAFCNAITGRRMY